MTEQERAELRRRIDEAVRRQQPPERVRNEKGRYASCCPGCGTQIPKPRVRTDYTQRWCSPTCAAIHAASPARRKAVR